MSEDRVIDRAPGNGGHVRDKADWVVIGSGPSGAAAAWTLTQAGEDVIVIEEGGRLDASDFDGRAWTAQKLAYREFGAMAAMGKSVIPLIQGRCVGGGSVINAAIIWRMPRDVFDRWTEEHGIKGALEWKELEDAFLTLERELNVKEVSPEALGKNNALLKKGADSMGISSRIIPRNERGCEGRAQCVTGCPVKAKQSADLTCIPWAVERGARLYHSCRAGHIDVTAGRARAVHGEFEDPWTGERRGKLTARAGKGVIVCASAIQTPALLMRSGIGMSSGHLGRHLMGHPGSGVLAVYPDEVRMWEGATQGWDSEHFRKSDRVKFEALAVAPDLLVMRMPGAGKELAEAMRDYPRMGSVGCALISGAEGAVRPFGKRVMVSYSPTKADMECLKKGVRILAEVFFAAGAQKVLPGISGVPPYISKDEVHKIDEAKPDPRKFSMVMTHLFSTARMGPDPRTSVVGLDFQVHDTRGVYVLDSSVFPTNLGVNPQHTIMAMAMAAAKRLA